MYDKGLNTFTHKNVRIHDAESHDCVNHCDAQAFFIIEADLKTILFLEKQIRKFIFAFSIRLYIYI